MELRHLRYFVSLAECLNFTRAAERVHVTQSTLSHQIAQLEQELGTALFERLARRVVLTEAGESFLAYAAKALKEVDQGVSDLKRAAGELSGVVRIGATHTFNIGFEGGFLPIKVPGVFPNGLPAIATAAVVGIAMNLVFTALHPPETARGVGAAAD